MKDLFNPQNIIKIYTGNESLKSIVASGKRFTFAQERTQEYFSADSINLDMRAGLARAIEL